MPRTFTQTVDYPQPVEIVWSALTDAKQMGLWMMNFDNTPDEMTTDFRPVVGSAYRLEARKGRGWRGFVAGKVLEVIPQKRLVLTWADKASQDQEPIRIEFTLDSNAAGTTLQMVQSGFAAGIGGWFAMKMGALGWKKMLSQSIRPVLERPFKEA